MRHRLAWVATLASGLLSAFSSPAFGQAATAPPSPREFRLPAVAFGASVGRADHNQIVPAAHLQIAVARNLVVEGEIARTAGRRQSPAGALLFSHEEQTWTAGANLLYRTDPRRVTWFAGGGFVTWRHRSEDRVLCAGCTTSSLYSDRRAGAGIQAVTGVDVRIAGPVVAFASLQFTPAPGGVMRVHTGVRVIARTRSAVSGELARTTRLMGSTSAVTNTEDAVGREVRVTLATGARHTGRLVGMSASDVTISGAPRAGASSPRAFALTDVLVVERVRRSPGTFAVMGAAAGAATGVTLCLVDSIDMGECMAGAPLIVGSIGAAAGAIIGAIKDAMSASRHVIYVTPRKTLTLAPMVTLKRVGIAGAVRW